MGSARVGWQRPGFAVAGDVDWVGPARRVVGGCVDREHQAAGTGPGSFWTELDCHHLWRFATGVWRGKPTRRALACGDVRVFAEELLEPDGPFGGERDSECAGAFPECDFRCGRLRRRMGCLLVAADAARGGEDSP